MCRIFAVDEASNEAPGTIWVTPPHAATPVRSVLQFSDRVDEKNAFLAVRVSNDAPVWTFSNQPTTTLSMNLRYKQGLGQSKRGELPLRCSVLL